MTDTPVPVRLHEPGGCLVCGGRNHDGSLRVGTGFVPCPYCRPAAARDELASLRLRLAEVERAVEEWASTWRVWQLPGLVTALRRALGKETA